MLSMHITNGKVVVQVGMSPKSFAVPAAEQGHTPRSTTPGPASLLSLPLKPLEVAGGPALVLAVPFLGQYSCFRGSCFSKGAPTLI